MRHYLVYAGVLASLGAACAHEPPAELMNARAAYRQASNGIAAREAPAQLHTAHNALEQAEQSFVDQGDSEHTRDLSYVALRKAQLAQVQARVRQNEVRLAQLESAKEVQQRAELAQLREQTQAQQEALDEAHRRAEHATAELARVANVKQDQRGTVITLSGEVLFTSGKAELMPGAEKRLEEVAAALKQREDAQIIVEGYTDSQGSDTFNLDLSTRRAEAVRTFLSAHGVAPERIKARGMGEAQPVGNNRTAEGRANNRRVEIVVQKGNGPS